MPRKERTLPERNIKGWGTARSTLEVCKDAELRNLLAHLLAESGAAGGLGLEYVARRLRYHAGDMPHPVPPWKLSIGERKFCEARAMELMTPFVEANDRRLVKGGRP